MTTTDWVLTAIAVVWLTYMVQRDYGRKRLPDWFDYLVMGAVFCAFLLIVSATVQMYGWR